MIQVTIKDTNTGSEYPVSLETLPIKGDYIHLKGDNENRGFEVVRTAHNVWIDGLKHPRTIVLVTPIIEPVNG